MALPLKVNWTEETGRPGLKQFSGFVQEEFLQQLRGQKGARIYREMGDNSAVIGSALLTIEQLVRNISRRVEPYTDKDKEAQADDIERAERLEEMLDDMEHSWSDFMSEVCTMFQFGYAPMEIVVKKRNGWSNDKTKCSKFDDGLVGIRKLGLRSQESVYRWLYEDGPVQAGTMGTGQLKGVIQLPPPWYRQIEIPIEKLLLFRPRVERGNPEGRSLLRSAYWDYYITKRLVETALIGAEKNLHGVPVIKIPAVCMTAEATPAQQAVFAMAKKIGSELRVDEQNYVVIASDIDPETKAPLQSIELLSTSGRSTMSADIDKYIIRHETRAVMAMLMGFLMLGHDKVGSFALVDSNTDTFATALGAWLDSIYGVLNTDLVPVIWALNGWPLDRMAKIEHGDVESRDLAPLGDFIQKVSAAGVLTYDSGLEDYIRDVAHLPEKVEGEEDTGIPIGAAEVDQGEPEEEDVEEPTDETAGKPKEVAQPKEQVKTKKAAHQPRSRRGQFALGADTQRALELLYNRQRVGSGDSISHGFKIAQDPPFRTDRDMTGDVERAPVELVDLSGLMATQPNVRRDRVRSFIENPHLVIPRQRGMSGALEDMAVVVRYQGQDYIQDGHHRAAAERLKGRKTMLARVVTLGQVVTKGTVPPPILGHDTEVRVEEPEKPEEEPMGNTFNISPVINLPTVDMSKMPTPQITVADGAFRPQIDVAAPQVDVHVEPTPIEVTVEQQPALHIEKESQPIVINVPQQAPPTVEVSVAAPNVTVNPTLTLPEEKPTRKVVIRDEKTGLVKEIKQIPEE